MIKIYTTPSCSSCRKVKKWFEDQKIPFVEKNIFVFDLTDKELKEILSKTENGTDDIISPRSKILQKSNLNIEEMSISELLAFIKKNPSVLKRPIIVDDNKLQVGYNSEEIRSFIPYAQRLASWQCSEGHCEKWDTCPHAQDMCGDEKDCDED